MVVGVAELRVAGDADAVVEEAADVLEVLLAIVAEHGATFDEFVAQRCPKVLGVQCTYVGNASCTSRDASAPNGAGSGMQAALKWIRETSFVGGSRMKAETSLNSTTISHHRPSR